MHCVHVPRGGRSAIWFFQGTSWMPTSMNVSPYAGDEEQCRQWASSGECESNKSGSWSIFTPPQGIFKYDYRQELKQSLGLSEIEQRMQHKGGHDVSFVLCFRYAFMKTRLCIICFRTTCNVQAYSGCAFCAGPPCPPLPLHSEMMKQWFLASRLALLYL